MFEKEAEEYGEKDLGGKYLSSVVAKDKLHAYKLGQYDGFVAGAEFGYNKVKKELEEERKLNAEIKARFVKCNTCTDEMKSKCLMFTENLCEGERCEELIDIVSLVNKSDLERKIEALEKANEWHYVKDGDLPKDDKNFKSYVVAYYGAKGSIANGKPCWEELCYDTENKRWVDKETLDDIPYVNQEGIVIAWKEIVLPELKESE